MDSGLLIIILIFVFALLAFACGVYCHFCGETGSGGRYFGSDQNIVVATALYTKRAAKSGDPTSNNCRCSHKFKGVCEECEGQTFVDDGELGSPKDFSNFGGDRGFEFPGGGGGGGGDNDPIRGFMGNGSAPTSALDQPDQMGGGGGSGFGASSDQY